jgi:hypothetical protein
MTAQKDQLRQLFGGAFVCRLRDGFLSAEKFRQVPDNQEVCGSTILKFLIHAA